MGIVSRTCVGLARESDAGRRLLLFDTRADKQMGTDGHLPFLDYALILPGRSSEHGKLYCKAKRSQVCFIKH